MDTWARVVVLVVSGCVGIGLSVRHARSIRQLLVRRAHRSTRRAALVVVVWQLALLGAALALAVVAVIGYQIGVVPGVLVCGVAVAALSPVAFAVPPRDASMGGGSPTSRAELQAVGATADVSRVIAWSGALLFFVVSAPIVGTYAILVLVLGRG